MIDFRIHGHILHVYDIQGCGNIEPTVEHFDLFSPLLSYSPYTLYTVQFQFTGHSLYIRQCPS